MVSLISDIIKALQVCIHRFFAIFSKLKTRSSSIKGSTDQWTSLIDASTLRTFGTLIFLWSENSISLFSKWRVSYICLNNNSFIYVGQICRK